MKIQKAFIKMVLYYTLQEQKAVEMFYDDLKLPWYQTQQTKRYKDVDKFIKDGTIEVDGKKLTGITDIISHSLGSAVSQQINNDYGNIFRSRSYGVAFCIRTTTRRHRNKFKN